MRVAVVGAGVFGLSGALELARRGAEVLLFEQGQPPHPRAATTDISKLIRPDYGTDDLYADEMLAALPSWRRSGHFLETGLHVLAGRWEAGEFEHDSFDALAARGLPVQRLAPRPPAPAWARRWPGYTNPWAGWAPSAQVLRWLVERAREAGVQLYSNRRVQAVEHGELHLGAERIHADRIVLAAGSWTPTLLPELASVLRTVGQPVFHLRPEDPTPYTAAAGFLPWCADIAHTGWYGFPAQPDGIVKIANHGAGIPADPCGERELPEGAEADLRAFLHAELPGLSSAPIVRTRLCLYTDTPDGHFLIDQLPEREGLVLATGGSGHAFKFAPRLGSWIADAVEGRPRPRFAWRRWQRGTEAARAASPGT